MAMQRQIDQGVPRLINKRLEVLAVKGDISSLSRPNAGRGTESERWPVTAIFSRDIGSSNQLNLQQFYRARIY